jgi:YfiR/HmsC-like
MSPARPPEGAHSLLEGQGQRPMGAAVTPARPPEGAHSFTAVGSRAVASVFPRGPWTARQLLHWMTFAAVLLAGAAASRAWAQDAQSVEYRIKAAFLCKFGNYVEWAPAVFANEEAPFAIGVWAPAAVADEVVRAATGQTVAGRPIVIRRLTPGDVPEGLQLLYIARVYAARAAAAIAALKDRPVLTVTEIEPDAAAAAGSMINFVVADDKVKFDVALGPAERTGLKISARLLGVARLVAGRSPS